EPIGAVIGESIAAGISAVVHVFFWVTLVFAILERSGADAGARWDVDQLPEPQSTGVGRVDAITTVSFGIMAVAENMLDQLRVFVRSDGEALPFLQPQLWPWWLLVLITLIVAEVALAIVASARKRWTTGSAVINTGLAVVFL